MPAVLPNFLRRLSVPKQRRRHSFEKSRGEALEHRVLPAAVAVASKSTLTITGNADASDLSIEEVTGGVKVTALNGTTLTVNGQSVADATFTGITTLNVRLGEGDDSLQVFGALSLKNVSLDLGDGDNVLDIDDLSVTGKLTVKGGNGNDQISLDTTVAKLATFSTGLGNDLVSLEGTAFSSTVSISTASGADVVIIDDNGLGLDSNFANTLTINTGEDGDVVAIRNATTKRISVATGDDDDVVDFLGVTAGGTISVQTSAGDDVVTVSSVTETLNGTNLFDLGTGADTMVMAGSSFQGTVNINLGTGINNVLLIDDTSFNSFFNLTANGVADVINIEQNLTLAGDTTFTKAAKLKVGTSADINVSVIDLTGSSFTRFLSSVSVSGVNPSADLTVVSANTAFFSAPTLLKTNLITI
jgi:hypothetical protein